MEKEYLSVPKMKMKNRIMTGGRRRGSERGGRWETTWVRWREKAMGEWSVAGGVRWEAAVKNERDGGWRREGGRVSVCE